MSEIKSVTSLAVQRATAIAKATESLANLIAIEKDNQTTVAGNAKASSTIDLAQTTASQMGNVLSAMSTNIHNLSSAFHTMDQKVANQLSHIDDASTRFTLNG